MFGLCLRDIFIWFTAASVYNGYRASPASRWQRICLQCRRPGFNPWVRKIPWGRKCTTPVFLPGKYREARQATSLQCRKESDTTKATQHAYIMVKFLQCWNFFQKFSQNLLSQLIHHCDMKAHGQVSYHEINILCSLSYESMENRGSQRFEIMS